MCEVDCDVQNCQNSAWANDCKTCDATMYQATGCNACNIRDRCGGECSDFACTNVCSDGECDTICTDSGCSKIKKEKRV